MPAPSSLKIQGKEYIKEVIAADTPKGPTKVTVPLRGRGRSQVQPLLKAAKSGEGWDLRKVAPFDFVVTAKVKIPKELWAPVHKKIGDDKVALKKLKELLRQGEPAALIEFARDKELDYDVLRKMMSIVNPNLHSAEVLSGVLSKAVRALKDAGVVSPISITQKVLWQAWMKAIDDDAQG